MRVNRSMEIDFQFFINTVLGIVIFFGGWILKTVWEKIREIEEENESIRDYHIDDLKEVRKDISNLALSLPEKYVTKDDFNQLVKVVHHRFDRLEEKLDSLKK